ncbi:MULTISPECIES: hypothetical protein [Legionella]|uniref:Uncharacterized protein n=1 Tax=Legionella donaldsonii TaxID=45060 RepID=A0A378JE64_9GAMM|nr:MULTISPECIES: hypothetical protein [Legionella]MCC5015740.1 hypothetical protein [Legionella sp. 31fI33]STX42910.1 Uncharacterised protein [Legionella donaldsonii]
MQRSEWEIIVLKPTAVFLSFLSSQLPDLELPELNELQTDNTAYVIPRQDSEEATLNEIERHFPTMFRYEISRLAGKNTHNRIEGTFLDFLCCFKFELHSQIVLMESSVAEGRQLLRIKPRSVLLKWMRTTVEEKNEIVTALERINLSHLAENATVIIKNFAKLADVKPFLKHYYRPIFEAEMLRMCDSAEEWPEVESYQDFCHYFAVNTHSRLIHLH